jgi:hypothetical protein
MKAIYKGKLYTIVDDCTNMVDLVSMDDDTKLSVMWSDPSLILDPTDDEINNILPDADEPQHPALDQIVGCNVHGRLTCILALLDSGDLPTVRLELGRLLKFFPNPVAKP